MNKVRVFGKEDVIFVFFRYLSFGIMGIRGLIFAYVLGPYFLGIYGYLMLYQQYLSYSNLGLQYSVNTEMALSLNEMARRKVINSALTGTAIIAGVLLIIFSVVFFLKIQLFPYKDSHRYVFILFCLTIFSNFQQIFVNYFRAIKRLRPILISELITAVSSLCVIPFYTGIDLINAIFFAWIISIFFSLLFFIKNYDYKISFGLSHFQYLLKTGFPILIYVFSYYLMGLVVRSLIGSFYSVSVMGYFSFATNITTAIMLGIDTITWIIFPTLIGKLGDHTLDKGALSKYLIEFTNKLVILVIIIVSLSIASLPILFYFLPKYIPIEYSLVILLVNQIVFNSGFAFVSLCIARKMHTKMALISLISVIIGGIICFIFCHYKLQYIWLVVSNIIASLCFVNILIYFISKEFELSYKELIKSFDWFIQSIFILIIVASIFESYLFTIVLLIIILLYKSKSVLDLGNQLIRVLTKKVEL